MNEPTKNILRSRTIWFNTLTIVATLSGLITSKWGIILLSVTNIALRIVTTQGLTFFQD